MSWRVKLWACTLLTASLSLAAPALAAKMAEAMFVGSVCIRLRRSSLPSLGSRAPSIHSLPSMLSGMRVSSSLLRGSRALRGRISSSPPRARPMLALSKGRSRDSIRSLTVGRQPPVMAFLPTAWSSWPSPSPAPSACAPPAPPPSAAATRMEPRARQHHSSRCCGPWG